MTAWTDSDPADGQAYPSDLAIDAAGNIVLVATVVGDDDRPVGWVRKFAPGGATLWTQILLVDDGDLSTTTIEGVAVDATGDILLAGSVSTGLDDDAWVGRLAP